MTLNNESERNYIIGTCMKMCPEKEIKMRERERLLHIFEIVQGTENHPMPIAQIDQMVKCFSRSAAGKFMQDPENLRPPAVLLETVNYLLDNIAGRTDVSWLIIYDFIMDRLRSVRQDMVIQNVSRAYQITILQPIIRFLAYASYRLCEENVTDFDPHINNTHLQECLKRLLCMYDYYDELNDTSKDGSGFFIDLLKESRQYFESLYVIFNLGSTTAITRAINLSSKWRSHLIETSLEISISYLNGNFVRVCKAIERLPTLLASLATLHLPELRRSSFKIMSTAYHSKNLRYPLDALQHLLLYNTQDEIIYDCKYYGLNVLNNGIQFSKTDFDQNKPKVHSRRSKEIDIKLSNIDISTLLLFGE
ncbi:unnamed protein product [Phaedon cochleariae]|uniref:SAC3/GANP/THP3 conserved domain-containing protein n=1 Tax=Phaedon cochleariae TaxID=80249 RepID=A0A9P0DXZ0_PHACE|nr:unnamed protein product [Phaedon cochleariae]